MPKPLRLPITSAAQVQVLLNQIEIHLDMSLDECRDQMNSSGAFVNVNEVNPLLQQIVALQELMVTLKQPIPHVSHSHPTIIPLTHLQATVIDTLIECAYDINSDMVTDPLYSLAGAANVTRESLGPVNTTLNEFVDRLVAATELRARWLAAKYGY